MGFLKSICCESLKFIVIILAIAFIPGIPPLMEFEVYNVSPPMPMKGPLALNNKLDSTEKLFEDEIKGPEHMEVHKGSLYTTLEGGYVVRIVGDKIEPIIKFGQKCDGLYESEVCGRPLGLRFDSKGLMYVADAYYGLFKVNISSGEYAHLVSMEDEIDHKKPKLPNSLDVGSDGSVYWSDSTTSHQLHDALYAWLGSANGRLLKYDPVTKNNTVLIDKVHGANGVALSHDESFVLVSELFRSRILRYYLKGPKKGQSDVFVDGIPGYPDNIHATGKREFYVSLISDVGEESPSVSAILGPYPLVRKALATFLYLLELPALQLNIYYPNYYAKVFTHWVGSLEMIPSFLTKRTTIIYFNEDGKITKSLHSKNVKGISDMAVLDGMYYLGSFSNPYLLRVKAS